jgi:hypothetical protein
VFVVVVRLEHLFVVHCCCVDGDGAHCFLFGIVALDTGDDALFIDGIVLFSGTCGLFVVTALLTIVTAGTFLLFLLPFHCSSLEG